MATSFAITIDCMSESNKILKSFNMQFDSENRRDAELAKLQTVQLPKQLRIRVDHKEPTDWAYEIGDVVPLRLMTVDHPKYVAMLTMEDPTYMKYYDDSIWLSDYS